MMKKPHVIAAVFAGGAIGTAGRAALAVALPHDPAGWPWATLLANLAGALLIGWWSVRLPRTLDIDPRVHPFLVTGLCGGLTTFSTVQLETLELSTGATVAYVGVSVAAGLAAVLAGRFAAHVTGREDAA